MDAHAAGVGFYSFRVVGVWRYRVNVDEVSSPRFYFVPTAMIHIGEAIRKQVEEQGRTSVWLARELGCHRTNLYKIYDKRTIDTCVLLRISRILNYDFFKLYSGEII